jgi:hypothetical protein
VPGAALNRDRPVPRVTVDWQSAQVRGSSATTRAIRIPVLADTFGSGRLEEWAKLDSASAVLGRVLSSPLMTVLPTRRASSLLAPSGDGWLAVIAVDQVFLVNVPPAHCSGIHGSPARRAIAAARRVLFSGARVGPQDRGRRPLTLRRFRDLTYGGEGERRVAVGELEVPAIPFAAAVPRVEGDARKS